MRGDYLNDFLPRMKDLSPTQDQEYIEKMILLVLKEQKVSLSQARAIFCNLIWRIEDENIIGI